VEALAHPCYPTRRLLELAEAWPENDGGSELVPLPKCRTARQLRPAEIDHLVAAYQSGSSVYELADTFGIHRSTVGRLLRKQGVDTTPPGLDPEQLARAIQLYQSGLSLSTIACKLSVPQSTMREHLLVAGVKMREARTPRRSSGV
jgi:DNA invertase Pin-like site-specific DNA recombinase